MLPSLEDAAKIQGVGAALCTFEAADATQIVRGLLRLDAVLAQFVTALAVGALVGIEA